MIQFIRRWVRLVLVLALAAPGAAMPLASAAEPADCDGPVMVFAAASLADAVSDIAEAFEDRTGCAATLSIAGSSVLARQIAAGAPAGMFLSANTDWVSWLAQNAADRLSGKPVTVAANRLVIVSGDPPASGGGGGVAAILSARFAMGDPAHVPAGIYAKTALETLGLWESVAGNAVLTENVRVAMALAARGETAAAIVYATDARLDPRLSVIHEFRPGDHPEIVYQAVLLEPEQPGAAVFLGVLTGAVGRDILSRHGFLPPPKAP